MIKRQIIWNRVSEKIDEETESHKYWFLLINEPREIESKIQMIHENLKPIMDEIILDSGLISGNKSRISYKLICFKSSRFEFETSRIYKGNWKRDDRLDERIITIEDYPRKWIS